MRRVGTGGRLGGAKRLQRNNCGPPWQESCRKISVGVDWERTPRSRIHREVVLQDGN